MSAMAPVTPASEPSAREMLCIARPGPVNHWAKAHVVAASACTSARSGSASGSCHRAPASNRADAQGVLARAKLAREHRLASYLGVLGDSEGRLAKRRGLVRRLAQGTAQSAIWREMAVRSPFVRAERHG